MADRSVLRGSSGLIDDFDGVITPPVFEFNSRINDGKTLIARMVVNVLDGDHAGEEEELLLSCGNGWEPADRKGETAQRENGKPEGKGFNNQTNYQIFLDRALDAGAEDVLGERVDEGTMPWHAALWAGGLRFHFTREEFKPFNWKEGDRMGSRLVPSEYLGLDDEAPATKTTAKKAAPKTAAKTEEPEGDDEEKASADLPAKVKGKLKKIAEESDDHDTFMERAYSELDDADSYSEVIDDPDAFYNEHHEG